MADQQRDTVVGLISALHRGSIDRRGFMTRAAGIGLSATLIGQVVGRHASVSAQDATPAPAATAGPGTIGMPGIEHVTDTSQGTIKLYSSWPLTGASEQIGGDSVASVQLALEDFGNAAGGFALEYEALDDGLAANNGSWDPAKEAENANTAVNDADAMVYIGTYNSGASKVSIPILNEAGMPMITPAATYPGLSKAIENVVDEGEPDIYYPSGKRNYMRVVPTDEIQGGAAANWALTDGGRTKAYIIHDNQLYGKGVATVFRNAFEGGGGEVLGFEAFDAESPDYQSLMTSIADAAPDVLYLGAIVNLNASKLVQDMRALMSVDDVMFLGPDGLINAEFIEAAGGDAEGGYVTFAGLPPDELSNRGGVGADWVARMTEKVGHQPDAYAVYAYEAAVITIQGIDQAKAKDRTAILDAMFATEGFAGLLGTYSFTETGDTDSTIISLSKITDGKFVFQQGISAAE